MNRDYEDCAERICAAVLSYQMGLKSVDYTLREYVRGDDEPISEGWLRVAKQLLTAAASHAG